MSQEDTNEGDDEQNDDSFRYYPQVTQHPTTIIEGEVVDMVTSADLDSEVEDTGNSFGVVYEDPTVAEETTIWRNLNIPEGFASTTEFNDAVRFAQADVGEDDTEYIRGQEVTEERVQAAQERLDEHGVDYEGEDYDDLEVEGTDYKVADPENDRDAEVDTMEFDGEERVTGVDVGSGTFKSEEVEEFDSDRIMVWYGGISGQRAGRILDFNGLPFARYTDDGYLIKGLMQAPLGWRNTNGSMSDKEQFGVTKTRDDLKKAETYPRVARPPVVRDDIEGRVFFGVGRFKGGNGFEPTIGRAVEDYESVLETLRSEDVPWEKEYDTDILDMRYDQEPEERLAAEFEDASNIYSLYHGAGWQDEPDNAQSVLGGEGSDTDGSSFDVEMDDEVEHPTEQEVTFAKTIAEKITGAQNDAGEQATPDEAFESKGGLEGVVDNNEGNLDTEPDVEAIREVVYENTDGLSTDDL